MVHEDVPSWCLRRGLWLKEWITQAGLRKLRGRFAFGGAGYVVGHDTHEDLVPAAAM